MRNVMDIIASLPPERQARIEAEANRLLQAENLRELRKIAKKTQAEVAKSAGINQESVSRLEARGDMLLSSLTSYVEGLGGTLTLQAELPGSKPVVFKLASRIARARRAPKPRAPRSKKVA